MYYVVAALFVINCFVLMFVILLQQGKGGDMASAFGGGSSQTAFGARAGATLLTKLTTGFAVAFMLGALVLAVLGQRGPGSVLSGSAPPPAKPAPAAPAPGSTPAPASTPGTTPAPETAPQSAPATPPATPPPGAPK